MPFPNLLALCLAWQISLPALVANVAKPPTASAPEASHSFRRGAFSKEKDGSSNVISGSGR
jgi:hypothetical protein